MKRTIIILSAAVVAVLSVVSCAKERFEAPEVTGDVITFSSFRQQVFTRADIDLMNFEVGTKYTLLAVDTPAEGGSYQWVDGKGFSTQPQEGTEATGNVISYEPKAVFRRGEALDFYGLTYGTTEVPALNEPLSNGVNPTITVSEVADKAGAGQNRLPDLMHSNSGDARNRTSAGGTVLLPFQHAMAAVNILVSKQDETDDLDAEKQLERVKIRKITLENVATTATMDVVTGDWTWDASTESGSRVVFESIQADGYTVGINAENPLLTAAEGMKEDDVDLLIIPTDKLSDGDPAKQLRLTVEIEGLEKFNATTNTYEPYDNTATVQPGHTVITNGSCTVTQDLVVYDDRDGSAAGPLEFLRNHKYTLSIFIMRDNVRIVAVSPQVYDWVPVNTEEYTAVLGQPVTFGGTVWMDRNLGAKTFDCENDFYNSMGYYYQFGRNIPWIIDVNVVKRYLNNQNVFFRIPATESNYGGLRTLDIGTAFGGTDDVSVFSRHPQGTLTDAQGVKYKVDSEGNKYREGTFGIHASATDNSDPLFFTYDEHGNKVSTWRTSFRYLSYDPDDQTDKTLYPALNPGDPGSYSFSVGPWKGDGFHTSSGDNKWGGHEAWSWTYTGQEPNVDAYRNHWGNHTSIPENQPAPKGWKIATRKEVYTILPEVLSQGWTDDRAALYQANTTHSMTGSPETTADWVGSYDFQYILGRITLPAAGTRPGLKTINHSPTDNACVYGIKHQGTDQAYRIKIEQLPSKTVIYSEGGKTFYFNYVRITRYPAKATDKFITDETPDASASIATNPMQRKPVTQTNLQDFDWDHPSAELFFPMQGYIDAGNQDRDLFLDEFGISCIMRVTTWTGANPGFNHTFYFRNSGVGSNTGSRNALGDPIRLIRDFNADAK